MAPNRQKDSNAGRPRAAWAGTLQFLRHFARHPTQIGAIAPSSRHLARAMVNEAGVEPGHVVVELGAGNGSFTRELVARHSGNFLTAFELSAEMAEGLRRTFPGVQVAAAPVEDLPRLAPELGITKIDRIVSGLPWALWSEARQVGVLDALAPFLAPGARLVTFHYIHSRSLGRVVTTRRLLQERFERVRHSPTVWANMPPAYVSIADAPRRR
ncbi:MAG: methyltransferase domain-containing protein [Verrucomicrobiae bacterium]|nr:methyltransferase domain-containing protein [Verrucomicrobiae bacterium]